MKGTYKKEKNLKTSNENKGKIRWSEHILETSWCLGRSKPLNLDLNIVNEIGNTILLYKLSSL